MVEIEGNGSITGASVSITCMVCDDDEVFPHASVAVQVRVTLYVPTQPPLVVTSFDVNVKLLPHSSVAEATSNMGTEGQLMVVGEGNSPITGAVIS